MTRSLRNLLIGFQAHTAMRNRQRVVYRSGAALRNHVYSAHRGEFTITCPACRELKSKTEEAQK